MGKFITYFHFSQIISSFGDIVPTNQSFLPATLTYIVVGLIITTMCIDLVSTCFKCKQKNKDFATERKNSTIDLGFFRLALSTYEISTSMDEAWAEVS